MAAPGARAPGAETSLNCPLEYLVAKCARARARTPTETPAASLLLRVKTACNSGVIGRIARVYGGI